MLHNKTLILSKIIYLLVSYNGISQSISLRFRKSSPSILTSVFRTHIGSQYDLVAYTLNDFSYPATDIHITWLNFPMCNIFLTFPIDEKLHRKKYSLWLCTETWKMNYVCRNHPDRRVDPLLANGERCLSINATKLIKRQNVDSSPVRWSLYWMSFYILYLLDTDINSYDHRWLLALSSRAAVARY